MLPFSVCACHLSKTFPLLKVHNHGMLKSLIPLRAASFKYGEKNSKERPEPQLKPLTGYDDESFTHNFKLVMRHPKLFKQGLSNFMKELNTFYHQETEYVKNLEKPLNEDKNKIRLLYTYEKPDDLKGYAVETDSSVSSGFSSASLKVTQAETALFSGYISEDFPKDGNVSAAGFATMFCPKQRLAFFRTRYHDWSEYSHLVFKIRGDGRPYLVLLHLPDEFEDVKYSMYAQILYTRGGPYWQIAKLPFSHFFVMIRGGIVKRGQNTEVQRSRITRMAITAAGFEGPFQLEIDYIGLEQNDNHKETSPYEEYH